MNRKTFVFDLFGTLVNDFAATMGQMHRELAAALQLPYDDFMRHWRRCSEMRTLGAFQTVEASIEHVCRLMSSTVSPAQMARAVEIRLAHTRRALEPKPQALETLTELKNTSCRVGLLSNCSIEIPIVWPDTPFARFIEGPIFSSRERLRKPDPRIYRLLCERLGVLPDDCVYIADGENFELSAAAKVGMQPILLRNLDRANTGETLREAREWRGAAVNSLSEILTIMYGRS